MEIFYDRLGPGLKDDATTQTFNSFKYQREICWCAAQ